MSLARKNAQKRSAHTGVVPEPLGRFPLNQLGSVNMVGNKTKNTNG